MLWLQSQQSKLQHLLRSQGCLRGMREHPHPDIPAPPAMVAPLGILPRRPATLLAIPLLAHRLQGWLSS